MVAALEAAGRLEERVAEASAPGIQARLGGSSTLWSDFNAENKSAMLKGEILSWPLTLGLLVVAFGSLVANLNPIAGRVTPSGTRRTFVAMTMSSTLVVESPVAVTIDARAASLREEIDRRV